MFMYGQVETGRASDSNRNIYEPTYRIFTQYFVFGDTHKKIQKKIIDLS